MNIMHSKVEQQKSVVLVFTLVLMVSSFAIGQVSYKAPTLKPNNPVELTIKGGETHVFHVELKKGEFVRAEVEQKDIDVIVTMIDADGKSLIEMDGDSNYLWRESISAIAEKDGNYKLQIKGKGKPEVAGSYVVKIAEQRKTSFTDRKRIEAEQLLVQAIKLSQENKAKESAEVYETSLSLWREVDDKFWKAVTTWNLAWAYYLANQDEEALKFHNQALIIFQITKDRIGEASAFNGIGVVYLSGKNYVLAKDSLEKALAIRKGLKRLRGEFNSLNALIVIYNNLNLSDKTLESCNRMLEIGKELKDNSLKADALKGLGVSYQSIKKYEKSAEFYEEALPIYQELKDTKNEIHVRKFLGLLYGSLIEYEKAKVHLERYAELMESSGERDDWNVYHLLGLVYESLQQFEKVLPNYEKAFELAKAVNDNRNTEGQMLSYLGSYYMSRSQYNKAKKYLDESLTVAEMNDNQDSRWFVLQTLANLHINLKEFEKAENYSEGSLEIRRKQSKYDEAQGLNSNGLVYLISGKYEKALENYELGLKINRDTGDRLSESGNLNNLGLASVFLGKYEQAVIYYQDSLEIAREKKHQRNIYATLNGLGLANNALSRFEEAKKHYEEALNIANNLQMKREIGLISNSLGNVYINLSKYEEAKKYIESALKIGQETGDKSTVNLAILNLGKVYANINQYEKAVENYEKALIAAKETKNIFAEYDILTNLGFVYINLNQYDKAKEYLEKAGELSKEIKSASGNVDVIFGLGAIYLDLNNPEKATSLVQQSLEMVQNVKNRRGEGAILNKLGEIYLKSKQYGKAKEQYEKALAISREVKNVADETAALINLGEVYLNLNEYVKAKIFYEQGLDLARKLQKPSSESFILNRLGRLNFKLNQFNKAEEFYNQALPIAKSVQNKKLEGEIFWDLMELSKETNKPQLAIIYGKQSVNAFQEIRGNIKSFDKESQQSYLIDKEKAYRMLAGLLISESRFVEAQLILNLLKEEEYAQLARSGEKIETIPYSQAESDIIAQVENLATLVSRRSELIKLENEKGKLSANEEKELVETNKKIKNANAAFDVTLKALKIAELSVDDKIKQIYEQTNFSATLEEMSAETGSGAVAIYTVIGTEDVKDEKGVTDKKKAKFGWMVLVTAKASKAYPIDVNELEETVFAFRTALSSDVYDPQPLAEKLYNKLFRQTSEKQKETLEADLQKLFGKDKAPTIMWSLDSVLRYIPMAALHDGKQYLAEKYRHIVFTQQSLIGLSKSDKEWKILGLGVSEVRTVDKQKFSALPGVEKELKEIVCQTDEKNCIFEGTRKLNQDFTKEETIKLWDRGKYPVIHISSHFSFNPTDQKASFLLVGDGQMTFADIENKRGLFNIVDLLTLSACDTAMSNNGLESESFAWLVQKLGAKTVLASLWKISDSGTPELMIRFYKLRAENPKLSKGEAFRQAQLSLLNGEKNDEKDADNYYRSPETFKVGSGEVKLKLYETTGKSRFSHPHYWASFVLIGNWK